MVLLAVVVVIVAAAAIFTGIDLFLALSAEKTARGRKPEYFNSGYKPEHGTEFCRAHLVGRVSRLDDKARAWIVPKTELLGVYLLKKGKYYKLAFEGELYD